MSSDLDLRPVFIKKNENLTRDQIRTLNVIRGRARIDSDNACESIIHKLDTNAVNILTAYVKQCQLNINFSPELFEKFAADTHYRSMYEIKPNLSSTRRNIAEDEIFLDLYKSVTAFERPKYGSIDIHDRPGADAAGYGKCYFILSDDIKIRTTIASCDTFNPTPMGVLDYSMHILDALSINELRYIYDIACKKPTKVVKCSYKEVQFHGPVSFATDIKCVCIPAILENDIHFIKFIKKFDLNYCTF